MQLTWLRTVHSGDWCLRSALCTLSGACQKWWWWWVVMVGIISITLQFGDLEVFSQLAKEPNQISIVVSASYERIMIKISGLWWWSGLGSKSTVCESQAGSVVVVFARWQHHSCWRFEISDCFWLHSATVIVVCRHMFSWNWNESSLQNWWYCHDYLTRPHFHNCTGLMKQKKEKHNRRIVLHGVHALVLRPASLQLGL